MGLQLLAAGEQNPNLWNYSWLPVGKRGHQRDYSGNTQTMDSVDISYIPNKAYMYYNLPKWFNQFTSVAAGRPNNPLERHDFHFKKTVDHTPVCNLFTHALIDM